MVEFLHTENKKPLFYLSFQTLIKIIIGFFFFAEVWAAWKMLVFVFCFVSSIFLVTEKGCAHAALHTGSEHHYTELCIVGFGGRDRLHRARAVH